MDIGPGDYVECIRTKNPESPYLGRVFLCESFGSVDRCLHGHSQCQGLHLSGLPRTEKGYAGCAFRPIYRPKADAFTHLLTDIPSDLEVV